MEVRARARARGRGFPMAILEKGAAGGKKGKHPGLGAASTPTHPLKRGALGELQLSAWNISVVFRIGAKKRQIWRSLQANNSQLIQDGKKADVDFDGIIDSLVLSWSYAYSFL